jgi:hypothetical protein
VRGKKRVEDHPGQVRTGEKQDHFHAASDLMMGG